VGSGEQGETGEEGELGGLGRDGAPGEIKKQRVCVTGGSHNVLVGIKLKFEGR
jgi:hypothetical protein